MAGPDLKLLGKTGILFTCRIVWALKLKGIEYEFIEEDLCNKSPLLLQLNPVYKKFPVLVHGGNPICESLIILEYIDDMWKENPILPKDPQERAYARFWAHFVDEKLIQASTVAFYSSGDDRAKAVESLAEALRFLEGQIKGKKFSGGETIGFLDIVVGWIAHWLPVVEEICGFKVMDLPKFPSLDSWIKNYFLQVPVIKENLPARDALCRVLQEVQNNGDC